ncbi:hypothetical protein [Paraburkholderia mimosarum]|uniref:hypothetical protein n=1 Tax=Paraburkholderia mimosarum TaxID=312026 RepID=UPI00040C599E|nr:hypothetical protein [Paraburkholderia mimosarum]
MNTVKAEVAQLEKALNALTRHPQLIRREYWISKIGSLLEQTELSAQDRLRLHALRDLPGLRALSPALSP